MSGVEQHKVVACGSASPHDMPFASKESIRSGEKRTCACLLLAAHGLNEGVREA